LGLAVLALATLPPSASASTIGHLTFANCGGGGVVVTISTIDFELPPLGGNGCIMTGLGTTVTFTGGTGVITTNEAGTVNDLGFPPPLSGNTGFISFPGVTFDLLAIGAGVANTACTNTFDPAAPACSVFAGSPFVLTSGRSSTTIAFYVSGVTNDASSVHNPWTGTFSTQLDSITPFDVQNAINTRGSFTATYSFDGNVVPLPEPVSMGLIGGGLIGLALLRRRKARA
jgi:hypothetical protein